VLFASVFGDEEEAGGGVGKRGCRCVSDVQPAFLPHIAGFELRGAGIDEVFLLGQDAEVALGLVGAGRGADVVDGELGLDGGFGVAFEEGKRFGEVPVAGLLGFGFGFGGGAGGVGGGGLVAGGFGHGGGLDGLCDFVGGGGEGDVVDLDVGEVVGGGWAGAWDGGEGAVVGFADAKESESQLVVGRNAAEDVAGNTLVGSCVS
jgi:hypothetical protein